MAKQLRFTYEGKDYTLEFNRKSVEQLEKQGFVASDITSKPMSSLPTLFAGAFLANHRFVKQDVTQNSVRASSYNKMKSVIDASAPMEKKTPEEIEDDNMTEKRESRGT